MRDYNDTIVGSTRLVKQKDYYTLRTLHVLPSKQRQGIGCELVKNLIKAVPLNSIIFCLPYPETQSFYEKFGFKKIPYQELPEELEKRFREYIKEFEVIAMKYMA